MSLYTPLPPLRPDLQIFHDEPRDGVPQYTLYDPLSDTYRRLGWAEATILRCWRGGITIRQLYTEIISKTSLRPRIEEIGQFVQLVELSGMTAVQRTRTEQRRARVSILSLLYARFPLVRPEAFLQETLPLARILVCRPLRWCWWLLTIAGLFLLFGQLPSFTSTFVRFVSPSGALAYAVALLLIKLIHELAHAYTATTYGVRVRSMGVALIVLWPVPYSDVTDAWRLPHRMQRLRVALAGVQAEMAMAGLAILGWCLTPPGILRDLFFLIGTVTPVATLVVNLNPAMRFDGYYLLSDWLGVDNLQSRGFALTKWWLRKYLLDIRAPAPEPPLSLWRFCAWMGYSVYSWIYKLGLYSGIVLMIYAFFGQTLGVIAGGMVAATYLMAMGGEGLNWWRLRRHWKPRWRFALTLLLVGGVVYWITAPLPRQESVPAVLLPDQEQVVYAPISGVIEELHGARGDTVSAGDLLLRIASEESTVEATLLDEEIAILKLRLEREAASRGEEESARLTRAQLARNQSALETTRSRIALGKVRAALDGTIVEWDRRIREGMAIANGTVVGRVEHTQPVRLLAYVPEEMLPYLHHGVAATFVVEGRDVSIPVKIKTIARNPVQQLPAPTLAARFGGQIPLANEGGASYRPLTPYYEATLLYGPADVDLLRSLPMKTRGSIEWQTPPVSIAGLWWRYAYRTLLRHTGS